MPLPHHYHVRASGAAQGPVSVHEDGLPTLQTQAPPQFGGPEGFWSPETLLTAAVADCFILSFRAVARAVRLEWESLDVDVTGLLEKAADAVRFTSFTVAPRLVISDSSAQDVALRCLERAEQTCLVSNSLKAEVTLQPVVDVTQPSVQA
ncbi:MAG TPA: OsmC family protein [Ramlibacter sp.]|uniref:OsmC family protein n=1 Tax=Ramlibacter sp. TaxID=1917967 RepID=UPI002D08A652|nr:OsmC family protein [Ramlibacter sp.]HVZ44466.1 OsmC family protein [Ramlibacter sp.]